MRRKQRLNDPITLVAQRSFHQGQTQTEGPLHVEGRLEGTILCAQQLSVGPQGMLKGEIVCAHAIIGGRVEGKLQVQGSLHVLSSGHVEGQISYQKLSVDRGGMIIGKICTLQRSQLTHRAKESENPGANLSAATADPAIADPTTTDQV